MKPPRHILVCHSAGRFCGWPANTGIWSWGSEILVGFAVGRYLPNTDSHSTDLSEPNVITLARSLDGGETWSVREHPELASRTEPRPFDGAVDFAHPDLAFRTWRRSFWFSYDRGEAWEGPFALGGFGTDEKLTSRTDYLVAGKREALLFMAAEVEGVRAGRYKDRAFCARTIDGGKTFQRVSWINGEPRGVRATMPSTVRVSATELVSVLRRRYDIMPDVAADHCWLDAFGSQDNGTSWSLLSRVAYTDLGKHNGNPPALVKLSDGRICAIYGFRAPAFGMRAKISPDNGRSWGPELTLRDDAATWDFGYPGAVVRPDGKIVVVYYYTTSALPEQHIAATIWDPT